MVVEAVGMNEISEWGSKSTVDITLNSTTGWAWQGDREREGWKLWSARLWHHHHGGDPCLQRERRKPPLQRFSWRRKIVGWGRGIRETRIPWFPHNWCPALPATELLNFLLSGPSNKSSLLSKSLGVCSFIVHYRRQIRPEEYGK